jgi:hypothetical protein
MTGSVRQPTRLKTMTTPDLEVLKRSAFEAEDKLI